MNKLIEEILAHVERMRYSMHQSDRINKYKEETEELLEALDMNVRHKIKEELADVIITTVLLAKSYDIDVEKVVMDKIKINEERVK